MLRSERPRRHKSGHDSGVNSITKQPASLKMGMKDMQGLWAYQQKVGRQNTDR